MKNLYKLFVVILLFFVFSGCDKTKFPDWDYSNEKAKIVFDSKDLTLDIDAEIFADATVSMSGFSSDPNSHYNKFIDDLASVVETSFKSSRAKFYRFGANSEEITSSQFLSAKKPDFYTEAKTNIEEVIKKTDSTKISIVLTDLFQDQKNLHAVVTTLKQFCLSKGLSLAVLGVASEFTGKVYDANVPPFDYKSKPNMDSTFRPFYAFMLGSDVYLEKFYKNLASKNPIYKDNFLLISGRYVSNFQIAVEKNKASKGIKKKRSDDKDPQKSSHLWVLSDQAQQFDITWKLDLPGFMSPLKSDNIKFKVTRQLFDSKSERYTSEEDSKDLQFKESKGSPGESILSFFTTSAGINKGLNAYRIYMLVDPDSKVNLPEWVTDFNSDDPTPSKGPNKTLNLEKFVSDLVKASWVINQPKLGIAYLTIKVEK